MLTLFLDKIKSLCPHCNVFTYINASPEWLTDAVVDSIHLIPFLFLAFLIIEFIEYYHADKINRLLHKNKVSGVFIGSLAAIFPQCGFSVMAAGLYSKRLITLGTLLAVFLVTSDETIPILCAIPSKSYLIVPIIGIKFFIGVVSGLIVDAFVAVNTKLPEKEPDIIIEEGCCKHDIEFAQKRELIIHPLVHTINVFLFICLITIVLNCLFFYNPLINIYGHKFIQSIVSSVIGLVPNCAVSIALTMMLVKGTITFGTAMSGLLSNAGLGLLVLLKNNDFKDTCKIIFLITFISSLCGIVINLICV